MKLAEILRAPKYSVRKGAWQSGPVPNSAFPLKGSGKLSLGRGYDWRVVTFCALGAEFVVLLKLSLEKETYAAILAIRDGKRLKVLCHHELHTSHRGWHCHMICGNVLDTFSGVLRDRNAMRVKVGLAESPWSRTFDVTKENALTIAAKRFGFAEQGDLI